MDTYTPFERFARKLDRVLSKIEDIVSIVCFTVIAGLVIFGILTRVALHIPCNWSEETCRILMIIVVYTGLSIVTRERANLRLSMLADALAKTKYGTKIANFGADLLLLITLALLTVLFVSLTQQTKAFGQVSPALGYPMWWVYAYVTFCFGLTSLRQLMVMWDDYFSKKSLFPKSGEDISVN